MPTAIVVGAGLAGLTTATHLADHGYDVDLLERRSSVGGRVRSRTVDGFTLDYGFQVLFTAYPAVQRELDLDALDLRRFRPGAIIGRDGKRSVLADPRRDLRGAVETLFNDELRMADKLRVLTLHRRLRSRDPTTIFPGPDQDIHSYLADHGFSTAFVESFAAPFYGGITLDRSLSTAAAVFEYTFRMLATGAIAVPADGMAAIPDQLASTARYAGVQIHTDTTVDAVSPDGTVTTGDTTYNADAVVVATDPPTAHDLTGVDAIPTDARGCITQHYRLPDTPSLGTRGRLLLNAEDATPNHVAPMSTVAPEYAPGDDHLLSATFLGDLDRDEEELAAQTRQALAAWYPARRFDDLTVLAADHIPYAQFPQPPGIHEGLPEPDAPEGVIYLAGEYTRWSSIQGALESGARAADAVRS